MKSSKIILDSVNGTHGIYSFHKAGKDKNETDQYSAYVPEYCHSLVGFRLLVFCLHSLLVTRHEFLILNFIFFNQEIIQRKNSLFYDIRSFSDLNAKSKNYLDFDCTFECLF